MFRLPVAIILAFVAQLACAQGGAAAAADRATAGTVSLVEGDVRFLDAKEQVRRPSPGDPVYEGDNIVTGSDGEVHLDMQDGGYIGVRPGTRMRIVNFKAEGGADDGFLFSLLEGSFRAVTGWITRSGSRRAEVQTPTVTIGIRGTDYEPLVIPEGSKAGEAGTYNRVNIGETEMRTSQGSVIVKPNQAGFVPHRGALPPRLLARVPAVFKPTRNEKRFEGLHQRIHQNLEEKRKQRVKQVEQRRQQALKGEQKKPAAEQRAERRRQQQQREEELRQKRLQDAQKQQHQREAQKAALKAQRQAEEQRRRVQQQERAAKKAEHERRTRHGEKHE